MKQTIVQFEQFQHWVLPCVSAVCWPHTDEWTAIERQAAAAAKHLLCVLPTAACAFVLIRGAARSSEIMMISVCCDDSLLWLRLRRRRQREWLRQQAFSATHAIWKPPLLPLWLIQRQIYTEPIEAALQRTTWQNASTRLVGTLALKNCLPLPYKAELH